MKVTRKEQLLLQWWREPNPREELTIRKDKDGRIDKGWIERSQSVPLDRPFKELDF